MALRAVPDHPKFAELKAILRQPKGPTAGWLEMMWHFTGRFTPQGNIGKYSDQAIESWLEWDGEPGKLIEAFVQAKWIDRDPVHRLLVHDWHQHADKATKNALMRAKLTFYEPSVRTEYVPDTNKKPESGTPSRLPEPVPEPVPEPETARTYTNGSPAAGSFPTNGFRDQAQFVANAVIEETGLTGWKVRDQIVQQAERQFRLMQDGGDAITEQLLTSMAGNWKIYSACVKQDRIRLPVTPERFFSDGLWKGPENFGFKKGQNANGIAV